MGKRAAKARPKRHDWQAARRRYVTDPTATLESIAQGMGADIATVKRHSADEGWVVARKTAQAAALKSAVEAVAQEQAEFAVAERRAAMHLTAMVANRVQERVSSGELEPGVGEYCALSRNLRELQATGEAPSSETSGSLILVPREPSPNDAPTSASSSRVIQNGSHSSTQNGKANGLPYTPRSNGS